MLSCWIWCAVDVFLQYFGMRTERRQGATKPFGSALYASNPPKMEEPEGERKDEGMNGGSRAGSPALNGHDGAEADAAMSDPEASTATEQGKRAASEEHREEAPQPKRKRFFDTAADSDNQEDDDDDDVKPAAAPAAPPAAAAPTALAKGKQAQRDPANVEILEIDDDDSDKGDMQFDGGYGDDEEDRKPVASSSKVKLESRTTPEPPSKARVPRNGKDFEGEKYFGCESRFPHRTLISP